LTWDVSALQPATARPLFAGVDGTLDLRPSVPQAT
jgi:hypothetical protein